MCVSCGRTPSLPPLQVILTILQIETTHAPQQQAQAAAPRAETIERYFSLSIPAFLFLNFMEYLFITMQFTSQESSSYGTTRTVID